jgi:hypothetical protein
MMLIQGVEQQGRVKQIVIMNSWRRDEVIHAPPNNKQDTMLESVLNAIEGRFIKLLVSV